MIRPDLNEVLNPAGSKIIRDHMREMLKAGESKDHIQELKRRLLALSEVLVKHQTPLQRTADQNGPSSSTQG